MAYLFAVSAAAWSERSADAHRWRGLALSDLLVRMPRDGSLDVRELLRYPENSAGGRMTTGYVALDPQLTVERAIDEVRRIAADGTELIGRPSPTAPRRRGFSLGEECRSTTE